MIDWHQRHKDKAEQEGRELLLPNATREQFMEAYRAGRIPAGSMWLWALGAVGPATQRERRKDLQ